MSAGQVLLIVLSGLGVIHGLFLAIFLWTYKEGKPLANRLLSLLLIVLSFRIGKSVFLEFLPDLDAKLIFTGLGTLMIIGPIFYFFTVACSRKDFRWDSKLLLHFIPAMIAVIFGIWIEEHHMTTLPMVFFLGLFLSYYGHLLTYLIKSKIYINKQRKQDLDRGTYALINLMFFGLLFIWMAYVLNLFEEVVPYVVGPVLYSLVAYSISFVVIHKGYLKDIGKEKYKTTRVSDEQTEQLFAKVVQLVVEERKFSDADLTLKSLSDTLKVSTQVLSMVINQKSQKNFNAFVNQYRVYEAIGMLTNKKFDNQNISAIAHSVGFNSLSSFNSAFKKQTGKTPHAYRQG